MGRQLQREWLKRIQNGDDDEEISHYDNVKGHSMHLKIFTLNCWALPWWGPSFVINCPDRKARIKAIAGYLASSEHDIICLQEVWSQTDQDVIQIACQDSHPYSIAFCG